MKTKTYVDEYPQIVNSLKKTFAYKVKPEFILAHILELEEYKNVDHHIELIKTNGIKEYLDNIHGIGFNTICKYFTKRTYVPRPITDLIIS